MSRIYEDSGLFQPLVIKDVKLYPREFSTVSCHTLCPANPWLQTNEEAEGRLKAF